MNRRPDGQSKHSRNLIKRKHTSPCKVLLTGMVFDRTHVFGDDFLIIFDKKVSYSKLLKCLPNISVFQRKCTNNVDSKLTSWHENFSSDDSVLPANPFIRSNEILLRKKNLPFFHFRDSAKRKVD